VDGILTTINDDDDPQWNQWMICILYYVCHQYCNNKVKKIDLRVYYYHKK
jgi:hypothetical protein